MEPADPRQARRLGATVLAVGVILTAWGVASTSMCSGQTERHLALGYAAMRDGAWDVACDHFREASSSSLLNDDAVFALHTCEEVRENDELSAFAAAVRDKKWHEALAHIPSNSAQKALQETFVSGVQNAP